MFVNSVLLFLALGSIDACFRDGLWNAIYNGFTCSLKYGNDHELLPLTVSHPQVFLHESYSSYFVIGSPVDIVATAYFELTDTCPKPTLAHGRVRVRQHSRLARFACLPSYDLVGNKYATCRNGRWDVPLPVCVRPSCIVPTVQNGISLKSHGGAWLIFFCLPKYDLIGSQVIYCDGFKWNASAPMCKDTTAPPKLNCDFEDPDICGWRQDDRHDFDWQRLNSKTPSSFLFTGPSFDHTLGKGHYGYYMYIESTSRVENDTARLISPVYNSSLTDHGCFSFSYHMYGKTCGGLRVYQKPDDLYLRRMIDLPEAEKQAYLIFEQWGNLGDMWYDAVKPLKSSSVDFQIVIEGIRGSSFTSDIAIDDVAILQGQRCTEAANAATTPATSTTIETSESCLNRCIDEYVTLALASEPCSCSVACFVEQNCCLDFFELCIFTSDSTTIDTNSNVTGKSNSEEAPQTLKLVAVTSELSNTTTTSTKPTTTPTSTSTRRTRPTRPPTKPPTTTSTRPTTTTKITTTVKPTTRITTKKPSTPYKPVIPTTLKTTTQLVSTNTFPPKTVTSTIKVQTKISSRFLKPIADDNYPASDEKAKKEQVIENRNIGRKMNTVLSNDSGESSTGVKVIIVIVVLTMFTMVAMAVHVGSRSNRVRVALARLRGYRTRDPEVRYMSTDVDDD